jgi:hypothetical protein
MLNVNMSIAVIMPSVLVTSNVIVPDVIKPDVITPMAVNSFQLVIMFVHTCDLDLAISPSDLISIEIFSNCHNSDSDNMKCFLACVNTTLMLRQNLEFFKDNNDCFINSAKRRE